MCQILAAIRMADMFGAGMPAAWAAASSVAPSCTAST